jgi:hypothetical protein
MLYRQFVLSSDIKFIASILISDDSLRVSEPGLSFRERDHSAIEVWPASLQTFRCPLRVDAVEKVFLNHGAQILRAVGASIRKFLGGSHHQMVNLPMTSVMELRDHRMAIAASFAFPREISSSVLRDFFDSIGQTEKNSVRANVFRISPESGPYSRQSALRICANRRHSANSRRQQDLPTGSRQLRKGYRRRRLRS